MSTAKNESDYLDAARTFKSIPEFRDSKELAKECKEKAETSRKDFIYLSNVLMSSGADTIVKNNVIGSICNMDNREYTPRELPEIFQK